MHPIVFSMYTLILGTSSTSLLFIVIESWVDLWELVVKAKMGVLLSLASCSCVCDACFIDDGRLRRPFPKGPPQSISPEFS
jgi:hypothetical protein